MKYVCDNELEELRQIVENHAKYQKVMVLYDDTVSNIELMDIYNSIKGLCIYNQMNIRGSNLSELNNGYKLVIFKCCADSILTININMNEFYNIFIPTDRSILPFSLLSNNVLNKQDDTLIQKKNIFDIHSLTSIYFNNFYSYFSSLFTLEDVNTDIEFNLENITRNSIIDKLNKMSSDVIFEDVKILKKMNIEYNYLALIDLLLINGFLLLISAVRDKSLTLVDVYKATKDDNALIDKFYAMINNDSFTNVIMLNYNYLYKLCDKTKETIKSLLNLANIDKTRIHEIIDKVKNYTKNSEDSYLSYLYLYDVFSV